MSTVPTPHRFTVAEYEQMGAAGIFTEDDRVELLAGEIIEMAALGHRHVRAVNQLGRLLYAATGDDLTVSIQNPARLGAHDEPEPDLVIARGSGGIPDAGEVLLVIEVADSSREYDRGRKFPLSGIRSHTDDSIGSLHQPDPASHSPRPYCRD